MQYICRPTDKQRLEKPANNTCHQTAKTSEIVVSLQSLCLYSLISKRLALLWFSYLFNFDSTYNWTYLHWVECETEQTTQIEQATFLRDNPSRRQGARDCMSCRPMSGWQSKLAGWLKCCFTSTKKKQKKKRLFIRDGSPGRPSRLSLLLSSAHSRSCVYVLFERFVGCRTGMTWTRTDWTLRCL